MVEAGGPATASVQVTAEAPLAQTEGPTTGRVTGASAGFQISPNPLFNNEFAADPRVGFTWQPPAAWNLTVRGGSASIMIAFPHVSPTCRSSTIPTTSWKRALAQTPIQVPPEKSVSIQ
jgi:hypothetical protein